MNKKYNFGTLDLALGLRPTTNGDIKILSKKEGFKSLLLHLYLPLTNFTLIIFNVKLYIKNSELACKKLHHFCKTEFFISSCLSKQLNLFCVAYSRTVTIFLDGKENSSHFVACNSWFEDQL